MYLSRTEQNVGAVITFFSMILLCMYVLVSTIGMRDEMLFLMLFGTFFIATLTMMVILTRKLRRENRMAEIDYLNVGAQRYILGLFMIFYGVPKLFGAFFDYQLFALDSKLRDVSEFELAWYFYGKNRWQELFTGIMEFIPGILLLNRRTWYFGALILLPVTGQVFILNFFFKIGGITLPAAVILLACNVYILYSQKQRIIAFFSSLDLGRVAMTGKTASVIKVCRWTIIVLAVLVVYRSVQRNFFLSDDVKAYQELVGVYTLESAQKGREALDPISDSALYKDLYIEKQSRWNQLRRFDNQLDAFVMVLNPENDSIRLYINKGGIGDGPDVLDSATVLAGIHKREGNMLTISGVQASDTLVLNYKRLGIEPKTWFW